MALTRNISSKYKDILSKSILISSGSPHVYQLRPKKEKFGTLARMTVGERNVATINKTIVFVGGTGSGKSTMINALVNYAMGVKWEDNLWFELVEEDRRSPLEKQTSDVIVYKVFGFENQTLPFSLTLIDIPGFGDLHRVEHDAIISRRLCDLLRSENGVLEADAVALVLKASTNRLSDRMLYIFNSVISLFGKDVEGKIIPLITHSNGTRPKKVLKALEAANIKCAKNEKNQPLYFLFDNCLTEHRAEDEDYLTSAHEKSVRGMSEFTAFLGNYKPQRLRTDFDVMLECIRLTACIQNLQERITLSELKQTEITQIQEGLKNQEITAEVDEVYTEVQTLKPSGWGWRVLGWGWLFHDGVTRCTVCEENCHYPGCTIARSAKECGVMVKGNCTSCTNKCPVSAHVKDNWIYVTRTRKVQFTNEELKRMYENKLSFDKEMEDLRADWLQLLEEAYQHIVILYEITLNVHSLSTKAHLDFLIDKMKQTGDTEKVQKLSRLDTLCHQLGPPGL